MKKTIQFDIDTKNVNPIEYNNLMLEIRKYSKGNISEYSHLLTLNDINENEEYEKSLRNIKHKNVIFLHIPKTGGTSIKESLGIKDKIFHKKANRLSLNQWNENFVFTFVRDPYTRCYSSWKFHTSDKYRGYLTKRIYNLKSLTFDRYLDHPKIVNSYFLCSQTEFIRNEFDKSLDFIGRFENLQSDFDELTRLLMITAELKHLNKNNKEPSCNHLSDRIITKINDIHSEDFDKFDYTKL